HDPCGPAAKVEAVLDAETTGRDEAQVGLVDQRSGVEGGRTLVRAEPRARQPAEQGVALVEERLQRSGIAPLRAMKDERQLAVTHGLTVSDGATPSPAPGRPLTTGRRVDIVDR